MNAFPQLPQVAESTKAAATAFFGYADQTFQGVEKLANLNLQAVKTTLAEAADATQTLLSVKTPSEALELQTQMLQTAPTKVVAYGRQVGEIVASLGAEQRAVIEAQMGELQSKFLDAMNSALKNAPGSENTVALVKSAVAFANNAYESVNKASKQVTEAVDANVIQFTETTAKAPRAARAKSEA